MKYHRYHYEMKYCTFCDKYIHIPENSEMGKRKVESLLWNDKEKGGITVAWEDIAVVFGALIFPIFRNVYVLPWQDNVTSLLHGTLPMYRWQVFNNFNR